MLTRKLAFEGLESRCLLAGDAINLDAVGLPFGEIISADPKVREFSTNFGSTAETVDISYEIISLERVRWLPGDLLAKGTVEISGSAQNVRIDTETRTQVATGRMGDDVASKLAYAVTEITITNTVPERGMAEIIISAGLKIVLPSFTTGSGGNRFQDSRSDWFWLHLYGEMSYSLTVSSGYLEQTVNMPEIGLTGEVVIGDSSLQVLARADRWLIGSNRLQASYWGADKSSVAIFPMATGYLGMPEIGIETEYNTGVFSAEVGAQYRHISGSYGGFSGETEILNTYGAYKASEPLRWTSVDFWQQKDGVEEEQELLDENLSANSYTFTQVDQDETDALVSGVLFRFNTRAAEQVFGYDQLCLVMLYY